jgi:hypothetical protein
MSSQSKLHPALPTILASVGVMLSAVALLSPAVARTQGGEPGMAQMRTADQYAARAAAAHHLPDVRAHLQQALNCLEGQKGPDYRKSAGDPCSGSGALAELPALSVNRIRVEKAIRLAAVGVTFHDFLPAHFTALAVRAVLAEGTR